jgi:glycosyltransferase involved in cell wall biosynthesis
MGRGGRESCQSGKAPIKALIVHRMPIQDPRWMAGKNVISILILTKDEEKDLSGCLASVSWSDDIHVYDSISTDRTVEIARSHGATVTQREFDNWASHQNWGLRNIQFKYPWVFYIDADERMSSELRESALAAVADAGSAMAFRVQRRDFWQQRWLKHVQSTGFYTRLFRPEKVRYERLVNPVTLVDGPVRQIAGYLDHFPFSKGVTHWLTRHNSYSTFEAQQIIADHRSGPGGSVRKAFFERDFGVRRYHQKELFYRLPARPLIKFLLVYVFRRGFMDGRQGLSYAILQAFYEYMIVLKTRELLLSEKTGGE